MEGTALLNPDLGRHPAPTRPLAGWCRFKPIVTNVHHDGIRQKLRERHAQKEGGLITDKRILLHYRAASKITTVNFDVRDCVVAASWCDPDRHHLHRAASPAPHFKRRGRASDELEGARSCSCCEVRLSALTRR